jgi:Trypsin-co-occurring domain 2
MLSPLGGNSVPIKSTIVVAILLALFSRGAIAQGAPPASDQTEVATIDAVVKQVQDALTKVQKDLKGKHLPQLKSVTLTLNTVVQKQVGASIKLWVITLGGKHETDQTQEVTVTLAPPSPKNPINVGAVSLSEALQSAIESAAQGVQSAAVGEYPLKFSGLTATIAFAVKNSGEAGGSIQILPISISLTGNVAKNQTQTIKVVFDDAPAK